jgi:hypothetical protein
MLTERREVRVGSADAGHGTDAASANPRAQSERKKPPQALARRNIDPRRLYPVRYGYFLQKRALGRAPPRGAEGPTGPFS